MTYPLRDFQGTDLTQIALAASNLKAVRYLRVSDESQISGDGFPRQREKINSYADHNDIVIVSEFLDEGVTGKMELESRAGLSACLQYVREMGIKIVLCESSDRLARDMIVAEVIVREFQKIGVKVISASGGINLTDGDDSNPTAKLIRQILAAVAEFDRCVIVLKLKGARDRIRAVKGKCDGRRAYGENQNEVPVLDRMRQMRDVENMRYEDIASILNSEGVPCRMAHKGKVWKAKTIQTILTRKPLTTKEREAA